MNYIGLVFDGIQSWSVDGKFKKRLTENIPTKSGVIGIILNAMGVDRDDESLLPVFNKIPIDTFVLKNSNMERDYQIANSPNNVNPVLQANGSYNKNSVIIEKDYFASMITGAILEVEDDDLALKIKTFTLEPERLIYFGRKSHMPNREIFVGNFDNYNNAISGLISSVELDNKKVDDIILSRSDVFGVRTLNTDVKNIFTSSIKSVRDIPVSFSITDRKYTERFVLDSSFESKDYRHESELVVNI